MSKEAMKLALEALELINLEFVCANGSHHAKKDRHEWDEDCPITDRWRKAITALQKALANEALDKMAENARELGLDYEPAQRTWVGLTEEEIEDIWNSYCDEMGDASVNDTIDIARAIESALRSKNT